MPIADPLLGRLREVALLHGEFVLASGQQSNVYFDKYQVESDPILLENVANRLVRLPLFWGENQRFDLLAGCALGGIPLATACSLHLGIPQVFVRNDVKLHGTKKDIEGPNVSGKRICLIEDVVTTGVSVATHILMLRQCGATIDHVVCLIQRDPKATAFIAARNCTLTALYQWEDLIGV